MKRKLFCLIMIIVVIVLAVLAIIRIKNDKVAPNLKKIKVADATITSLTLMVI